MGSHQSMFKHQSLTLLPQSSKITKAQGNYQLVHPYKLVLSIQLLADPVQTWKTTIIFLKHDLCQKKFYHKVQPKTKKNMCHRKSKLPQYTVLKRNSASFSIYFTESAKILHQHCLHFDTFFNLCPSVVGAVLQTVL